jgi:hypothetical protein
MKIAPAIEIPVSSLPDLVPPYPSRCSFRLHKMMTACAASLVTSLVLLPLFLFPSFSPSQHPPPSLYKAILSTRLAIL